MVRFWKGTRYGTQVYGPLYLGQFYGPVEKWAMQRAIPMSRIYLLPLLLPIIAVCVPLMALGLGAEWVMRTIPRFLPD